LVALKYAADINGLSHINITKLDVLSELDEIKVGVAYKLPDGTTLPSFPSNLQVMENVEVVYETLPGWKEDISKARKWDDLPENAQKYCQWIEDRTGVCVKWVGVGPGREALVVKPPKGI
jgi:adenylosuccinate synthase